MMHVARLTRLVEVLKDVAADPKKAREFDLEYWRRETTDCGTHLCAVGWGMIDPVLNEEGLLMKYGDPWYAGRGGWAAVEAFFDISWDAAQYLFSSAAYDSYTDINPVIARLEQFIRDGNYNDRR